MEKQPAETPYACYNCKHATQIGGAIPALLHTSLYVTACGMQANPNAQRRSPQTLEQTINRSRSLYKTFGCTFQGAFGLALLSEAIL